MKDIKNFINESYNESQIEELAKQLGNIINGEKSEQKQQEAFRVFCDYLDDEIDAIGYFEMWKTMNK